MAQPATLIGQLRTDVDSLLDSLDRLHGCRKQYDSLGGAAFLDPFFEANSGYDFTNADVGNAFNTVQAIEDLLAADGGGHGTNLNKVR